MRQKNSLSTIIWFLVTVSFFKAHAASKHLNGLITYRSAIFCLHDIGGKGKYSITLEDFNFLLKTLAEKYEVLSIQEWKKAIQNNFLFSKPVVILTFDDGYPSLKKYVLPKLKEYNFGATVFIYLDRYHENSVFYSEIKKWDKKIEIGSHSFTHQNLLKVYEADHLKFYREIYLSKRKLEFLSERKISSWAWPFGYYDDELVSMAKAAGYDTQLTTDYDIADFSKNQNLLPRFTLEATDTKNQIKYILEKLQSN